MSTAQRPASTGDAGVGAPGGDEAALRRLRMLGVGMVIGLLAELLLGMANAFWLSLPEEGSGWKDGGSQSLLINHMVLGTLVTVLGVWIAFAAWRARSRGWLVTSAVGILAILAAFGGGSAFMSDVSNDAASFLMAAACAVAIGAYAVGAALVGRSR